MVKENKIEYISFDAEGTLITTDFSAAIWFEGVPLEYSKRYNINFEEAQNIVFTEYEKIGDQRMEWYDINFWMKRFDLGDADKFLAQYRDRIKLYPETINVIESLSKNYKLIIASATPREFLKYLLGDIKKYFSAIFSSTSDYKSTKNREFYKNIIDNIRVTPETIIHVGDNYQFDFISAREAGITAYFLDRKKIMNETLYCVEDLIEFKNRILNQSEI